MKKLDTARIKHTWNKQLKPLVVILVVLTGIRSAVADWNDVPTGSMNPTILEGDRILVNKLAYDLKVPFTTRHLVKWDDPNRGDIVIFFNPRDGMQMVKRVIGVPGDLVEMRNNRLLINGHAAEYQLATTPAQRPGAPLVLTEELLSAYQTIQWTVRKPSRRSFGPMHIGEDQYLVLGDNRDNSLDSRWFGLVQRDDIVGRVTHVAFSVDPKRSYRPRWRRFGQRLD